MVFLFSYEYTDVIFILLNIKNYRLLFPHKKFSWHSGNIFLGVFWELSTSLRSLAFCHLITGANIYSSVCFLGLFALPSYFIDLQSIKLSYLAKLLCGWWFHYYRGWLLLPPKGLMAIAAFSPLFVNKFFVKKVLLM